MKKVIFTLISLVTVSEIAAIHPSLWLGIGWRQDSFDWNIAGSSGHPNVLSELEWKNIRAWQIDGGIVGEAYDSLYYRISGDYGRIYEGTNTDSDYRGDNRTELFSESRNSADRGNLWDYEIAIGYPYHTCYGALTLIPVVGFAQNGQDLTLHNGFQTFNEFGPIGPIQGLHSSYDATWTGGFIGADISYKFDCNWQFIGNIQYYWSNYKADGHWNLRDDIIGDFSHKGNGRGPSATLGVNYKYDNHCAFGVSATYVNFKVKDGVDTTKFIEEIRNPFGEVIEVIEATGQTRLNEVNWQSFRICVNAIYEF